ncbi:MAG: hypothetical protein J6U92_05240 [Clostridia bacterium]|nr:hypothetical protein [Clostridia bacterium]
MKCVKCIKDKVTGVCYDIKDAVAREEIATTKKSVATIEAWIASGMWEKISAYQHAIHIRAKRVKDSGTVVTEGIYFQIFNHSVVPFTADDLRLLLYCMGTLSANNTFSPVILTSVTDSAFTVVTSYSSASDSYTYKITDILEVNDSVKNINTKE